MSAMPRSPMGRRQFLLSAAAAGAAAVLVACARESALFDPPITGGPGGGGALDGVAYRLSSGGAARACGACKAHAANKYFQSAADAEGFRAHPGCNCRVLTQPVTTQRWTELFQPGGQSRSVFDVRAGLTG